MQPAAQEQLAQPMPTPLQILTGIVACATQIPDRFFCWRGRPDFCQQPGAQQLASLRASRRFVFTRSPGLRGTKAGAITWQLTRGVVIRRCSA
jgi:hypothetical protein